MLVILLESCCATNLTDEDIASVRGVARWGVVGGGEVCRVGLGLCGLGDVRDKGCYKGCTVSAEWLCLRETESTVN